MVYGNHEFDLGPEPLAKFIETAEFPVLSGNVDVSKDNLLAPAAEDHLVLEVGGEKVAILAATTPDTVEISRPGPERQLPRADPLPDRAGEGGRGGGREQGDPALPPRDRRRHPGRRGGAGDRPDRRRPRPPALRQRRRGAACLSDDGGGAGRARGADRPGRRLLEVPRARHPRVRRRRGRDLGDRRHRSCSTRA